MPENRVVEMARKAAELLPEPPPAHDAFGYLAWEELVVSTARRLHCLVEDATCAPTGAPRELPIALTLEPGTARLDGPALLTLATLLVTGDGTACEGALTQAVTTCQEAPAGSHRHVRRPHHQHAGPRRPAFDHARRSVSGVAIAPRG